MNGDEPPRPAPEPAPARDGATAPAADPSSTKAQYEVHPPRRAAEPPAPPPAARAAAPPPAPTPAEGPVAAFVVHGMGQQVPFATLDLLSEGLRREDARRRGVPLDSLPAPGASSVDVGDERLARAELKLVTKSGAERDVHIYEAYWAPLTEGQVNLRDVIAFLLRGAWNGVVNAVHKGGFRRWLFTKYPMLPVPASTLLVLALSAGVILALVAMNAAVVLVAAARSPLKDPPRWLSDALFADLTTLMNGFVTLAAFFGLCLLFAKNARRAAPWARRVMGPVSVGALVLLLMGTTLAGLSVPLLFWAHVRCAESVTSNGVMKHVLGAGFVEEFDRIFTVAALALMGAVAAALVLYAAFRVLSGARGEWKAGGSRAAVYVLALVGVLGVGVLVAGEVRAAIGLCRPGSGLGFGSAAVLRRGISWPLLLAISAWVRSLLVQYPGDVAAYVTPQALDKFQKLRSEIKETVWKRAHAVYAATRTAAAAVTPADFLYRRCAVVAHSLGSVVAYDVLNRMIQEDETATAAAARLDVVARTPLFLTLGSPLDKTAFVFGVAGKNTTEAREALAASVQPMICDYAFRPARWVNLFSPWDVVSGSLDFYDLPGSTDPRKVENVPDPDATTLLAAHLEYWENPLLFEILHAELTA